MTYWDLNTDEVTGWNVLLIDDENQVGAFLPVYIPDQPLKSVIETGLSALTIEE